MSCNVIKPHCFHVPFVSTPSTFFCFNHHVLWFLFLLSSTILGGRFYLINEYGYSLQVVLGSSNIHQQQGGGKSKEKKQQLKENFYPWIFGTPQSRLVILFGSGRQILFKCGQGHRRRSLQSNLADKSQRWCTRFGRPAQLICCFQVDFVMEFDIAVRQVVVIQQH